MSNPSSGSKRRVSVGMHKNIAQMPKGMFTSFFHVLPSYMMQTYLSARQSEKITFPGDGALFIPLRSDIVR